MTLFLKGIKKYKRRGAFRAPVNNAKINVNPCRGGVPTPVVNIKCT